MICSQHVTSSTKNIYLNLYLSYSTKIECDKLNKIPCSYPQHLGLKSPLASQNPYYGSFLIKILENQHLTIHIANPIKPHHTYLSPYTNTRNTPKYMCSIL